MLMPIRLSEQIVSAVVGPSSSIVRSIPMYAKKHLVSTPGVHTFSLSCKFFNSYGIIDILKNVHLKQIKLVLNVT